MAWIRSLHTSKHFFKEIVFSLLHIKHIITDTFHGVIVSLPRCVYGLIILSRRRLAAFSNAFIGLNRVTAWISVPFVSFFTYFEKLFRFPRFIIGMRKAHFSHFGRSLFEFLYSRILSDKFFAWIDLVFCSSSLCGKRIFALIRISVISTKRINLTMSSIFSFSWLRIWSRKSSVSRDRDIIYPVHLFQWRKGDWGPGTGLTWSGNSVYLRSRILFCNVKVNGFRCM